MNQPAKLVEIYSALAFEHSRKYAEALAAGNELEIRNHRKRIEDQLATEAHIADWEENHHWREFQ